MKAARRPPGTTHKLFALVASYGIGMGLLTPAVSALVSRRVGAHAGAALELESGAKSLGQIAGPLLGGVLFGASVAVPERRRVGYPCG